MKRIFTAFFVAIFMAILMSYVFSNYNLGGDLALPGMTSEWPGTELANCYVLIIIMIVFGSIVAGKNGLGKINLSKSIRSLKHEKIWDGEKWIEISYKTLEKEAGKHSTAGTLEYGSSERIWKTIKTVVVVIVIGPFLISLLGGVLRIIQ